MGRSDDRTKNFAFAVFISLLSLFFLTPALFAFEQTITVSAESPQGATLDLKKGDYIVRIEGGAMTLSYPVNPNYRWLIGIAVGTDVEGHQDQPNIGTLYFEPNPPAHSQAEAEDMAIKATKENVTGTYLKFTLKEDKTVRFWVNDFDYTDNNGMVKLRVSSV